MFDIFTASAEQEVIYLQAYVKTQRDVRVLTSCSIEQATELISLEIFRNYSWQIAA